MRFAYFATILALAAYAEGKALGKSISLCESMRIPHGVDPQPLPDSLASPYVVTTSTKAVKAGTPLEVTISGISAQDTIRAILLQARIGDRVVGTFKIDPPKRFTVDKCEYEGETLSHILKGTEYDATSVSYTWTPPANFNDIIIFRATILRVFDKIWEVESEPVKVTL